MGNLPDQTSIRPHDKYPPSRFVMYDHASVIAEGHAVNRPEGVSTPGFHSSETPHFLPVVDVERAIH